MAKSQTSPKTGFYCEMPSKLYNKLKQRATKDKIPAVQVLTQALTAWLLQREGE